MMKRLFGWLVPGRERELVLRELDDLRQRRFRDATGGRPEIWYLTQILAFAIRLRAERVRGCLAGLPSFAADIRFAFRRLLRRPGTLVSAALVLGIGTGGVAIVFGAAHWVLLRDVPGVGRPDELVRLSLESKEDTWSGQSWGVMQPDVERLRNRVSSLAGLAVATPVQVHLAVPGGGPASRERGSMVSPDYFDVLTMRPALGRFFHASDHDAGAGPAEVVVAHDLWRQLWNGSTSALGREVEVNGHPYTVIGVAPEGFRGSELPGDSRLWFPSSAFADLRPADAEAGLDGTIQLWTRLVGRRVTGASVGRVEAEANAAMEEIRTELTGQRHSFLALHFTFRVYDGIGLDPEVRSSVRRTLAILAVASLVLLALATANVANLALTRAASRRGTIAIRRALGAGAWHVAREPLIEGAVVGLLGGLVGLALLLLAGAAFGEAQLSSRGASLEGMTFGGLVVLVAVGTSFLAGVLSGVAPALLLRRERVLEWLGGDHRGGAAGTRVRGWLVVGQVALSGALLVAAGLFARTVVNLNSIDLGLSRDGYVFSVDPGLDGRDDAAVRDALAATLGAVRDRFGTSAAGVVFPSPLLGYFVTGSLSVADGEERSASGATFWTSGNGFFEAMGLPLVAGDGFDQELTSADPLPRPVVLNESMAARAFPGLPPEAAVGRRVVLRGEDFERTVVGVVADARMVGPMTRPDPVIFKPYDTEWSGGAGVFVVRAPVPVSRMGPAVTEAVRGAEPGLPVYAAGTVRDLAEERLTEQRVVGRLAGALGAVGLLLAALGLYGVLSYTVQERRREIGVRSALGAPVWKLRSMVVGRGVALTVEGLVAGLLLAAWVTRYVESRLFGVEALDPPTYALGTLVLLLVAVAASVLPAFRATRISPVEVLRTE